MRVIAHINFNCIFLNSEPSTSKTHLSYCYFQPANHLQKLLLRLRFSGDGMRTIILYNRKQHTTYGLTTMKTLDNVFRKCAKLERAKLRLQDIFIMKMKLFRYVQKQDPAPKKFGQPLRSIKTKSKILSLVKFRENLYDIKRYMSINN